MALKFSFIVDDSLSMFHVCESSVFYLTFSTCYRQAFPFFVRLLHSLYLLLLHEIGSELSIGKNASSDKLAPRMDFAMHCRKGLWLLCRKKVFPLESVFLLLRLHVCVPKPTMKLKSLQITS